MRTSLARQRVFIDTAHEPWMSPSVLSMPGLMKPTATADDERFEGDAGNLLLEVSPLVVSDQEPEGVAVSEPW